MRRNTVIVLLCLSAPLYSSVSNALSCARPLPFSESFTKTEVIALVKSESDVESRVMHTTKVFKGKARDSYFYTGWLENPIPNTCCTKIQPNTEYLIFTGKGGRIGYSWCGLNGIVSAVRQNNGRPNNIFFSMYGLLPPSGKQLVISLLNDYWPHVAQSWSDRSVNVAEETKEDWLSIQSQWHPEVVQNRSAALNLEGEKRLHLWAKKEREKLRRSQEKLRRSQEKLRVSDEIKELLRWHESGKLIESDYEYYGKICKETPESGYCVIFK